MNIALNGSQTIALGPFNVNGVPQAGSDISNFTVKIAGAGNSPANSPSAVGADGFLSYVLSGTDTATQGDVIVSATVAGITLACAAWVGSAAAATGRKIGLGPFISAGAPQAGVVPSLEMRVNGANQVPVGTAAATDADGYSAFTFASGDAPANGDWGCPASSMAFRQNGISKSCQAASAVRPAAGGSTTHIFSSPNAPTGNQPDPATCGLAPLTAATRPLPTRTYWTAWRHSRATTPNRTGTGL